jgi:hypothetical protein
LQVPSPLAGEGQGEGALFKSFHPPSPLSTPLDFLSSFLPPYKFPLHPAGEGRVRGAFKFFPFISSLPLRERTKVRGAVKFFSSFFPLYPMGQGKGSVKNQTKNQNKYPSALKYLISL